MKNTLEQPLVVAFFGISGSGKGTQAKLLENYLAEHDSREIVNVGMGSLVRAFGETDTAFAKKVDETAERGKLLPSVVPAYLLTDHLNKHLTCCEHVLLDGVSRRTEQSKLADELMRFLGYTNLHVISLTLTPEDAKQRLILRGREDDADDAVIAQRFSWYESEAKPALDALIGCGWTLHELDGAPSIEEIHQEVLRTLKLN